MPRHSAGEITTPSSISDDDTLAPRSFVTKQAFPDAMSLTYDDDGNVASVTKDGVTTTYTYNDDGTVHTDTKQGVTRQYTYDAGALIGVEVI